MQYGAPLLLEAWSGRSQTPSCCRARPLSGPRGRGSWPSARLWPRSPGQASAWAPGSGGCLGWLAWSGRIRPHLGQMKDALICFVLEVQQAVYKLCLVFHKWKESLFCCSELNWKADCLLWHLHMSRLNQHMWHAINEMVFSLRPPVRALSSLSVTAFLFCFLLFLSSTCHMYFYREKYFQPQMKSELQLQRWDSTRSVGQPCMLNESNIISLDSRLFIEHILVIDTLVALGERSQF